MGLEYAHCFLTCRMRRLNSVLISARVQHGTTPVSCVTSTGMPAQNAAIILKPLVPNPHSRGQYPLNHFYIWCNLLLAALHHSPVVSN